MIAQCSVCIIYLLTLKSNTHSFMYHSIKSLIVNVCLITGGLILVGGFLLILFSRKMQEKDLVACGSSSISLRCDSTVQGLVIYPGDSVLTYYLGKYCECKDRGEVDSEVFYYSRAYAVFFTAFYCFLRLFK